MAKNLKAIAQEINDAPAPEDSRDMLTMLGIPESEQTNAALFVASVFREACKGNVKAIEKWQELTKPDVVDLAEVKQTALAAVLGQREKVAR